MDICVQWPVNIIKYEIYIQMYNRYGLLLLSMYTLVAEQRNNCNFVGNYTNVMYRQLMKFIRVQHSHQRIFTIQFIIHYMNAPFYRYIYVHNIVYTIRNQVQQCVYKFSRRRRRRATMCYMVTPTLICVQIYWSVGVEAAALKEMLYIIRIEW